MNEAVLIVEDEQDIAELIEFHLKREGYRCEIASTGTLAWQMLQNKPPDLVLLDLTLPGMDGLTICKRMKASNESKTVPVIMVTARGEEKDIVTGLELGADDYIVKPFAASVLLARIKTVLRRVQGNDTDLDQILRFGEIEVDVDSHLVKVGGESIKLTSTEFRILSNFLKKPGRVFTRYQIVDAARGSDSMVTDRSVDVHIAAVRKKLKSSGSLIETVHGIGYRLKEMA